MIRAGPGRTCNNTSKRPVAFQPFLCIFLYESPLDLETQNERWTTPADNHNTTGQFDPGVHGFEGINAVSLSGYEQSIDPRIIQTAKDLPDEFPFNLDMNSGSSLGLGRTSSIIWCLSVCLMHSQVICSKLLIRANEAVRQLRIWRRSS